jgi:GT2 family glycosyltransferase
MGNIIGFKYAIGDYIVLLNNDTIVHDDWLKELVKMAEIDEKNKYCWGISNTNEI